MHKSSRYFFINMEAKSLKWYWVAKGVWYHILCPLSWCIAVCEHDKNKKTYYTTICSLGVFSSIKIYPQFFNYTAFATSQYDVVFPMLVKMMLHLLNIWIVDVTSSLMASSPNVLKFCDLPFSLWREAIGIPRCYQFGQVYLSQFLHLLLNYWCIKEIREGLLGIQWIQRADGEEAIDTGKQAM